MDFDYLNQPFPPIVENAFAILASVGTIATVIALFIGLWQLRKVKTAAQSAAHAAERAADELKKNYRQFIAGMAQRNLTELKLYVSNERWDLAATRVADLADQAAQMVSVQNQDETWKDTCQQLRQWEGTFRRVSSDEITFNKSVSKKWTEFSLTLASLLDDTFGPFQENLSA